MAGEIRILIDTILSKRSNGNKIIENLTITKFLLRGIDPEKYTLSSPDDPETIRKVHAIANEMGITF